MSQRYINFHQTPSQQNLQEETSFIFGKLQHIGNFAKTLPSKNKGNHFLFFFKTFGFLSSEILIDKLDMT